MSEWRQGFVPQGDRSSDDLFNDAVKVFMFLWMEIVDVTRNSLMIRDPLSMNWIKEVSPCLPITFRNVHFARQPLKIRAVPLIRSLLLF